MEEEERIVKGDDVLVELDAALEDLYMGGSLKVRSYLIIYNHSSLVAFPCIRFVYMFIKIHSVQSYTLSSNHELLVEIINSYNNLD